MSQADELIFTAYNIVVCGRAGSVILRAIALSFEGHRIRNGESSIVVFKLFN